MKEKVVTGLDNIDEIGYKRLTNINEIEE